MASLLSACVPHLTSVTSVTGICLWHAEMSSWHPHFSLRVRRLWGINVPPSSPELPRFIWHKPKKLPWLLVNTFSSSIRCYSINYWDRGDSSCSLSSWYDLWPHYDFQNTFVLRLKEPIWNFIFFLHPPFMVFVLGAETHDVKIAHKVEHFWQSHMVASPKASLTDRTPFFIASKLCLLVFVCLISKNGPVDMYAFFILVGFTITWKPGFISTPSIKYEQSFKVEPCRLNLMLNYSDF